MNIRNISANQITVWMALLLGLLAAVFVGSAVGSSDMRIVAGLIAIIPVAVTFVKLKTNIWILLPIGWYFTGRLPWLPLPFSVRDLCFIAVILFFALFFATRTLQWKRKLTALDYLIYINLAYLMTVFFRNPVGLWALQSSMVGGRPYFEIALAFGAFLILSRVALSDTIARVMPLFFVIPAWGVAVLDMIARVFPSNAYLISAVYSGVGPGTIGGVLEREARVGEDRLTFMQFAGTSSVVALCAKYNPITLISPLYPIRCCLLTISLLAIFLSGFRSSLLFALVALLLGSVLRGRLRDLWIAGGGFLLVLTMLIAVQGTVVQLPTAFQRTLAWLPGNWSEEAKALGEDSTRWRTEMWVWAWNDDRILRDKVWGQGFGLSIDDMNLIANSIIAGTGGAGLLGGSDRENFMITGTFHSGPLSSIKYIGAVGFILYYTLMCYLAVAAWKLCRRAFGTKAFALSLFIAIPIIYEPFNFIFVFGGLDSNYPQMLFWAGLLNLCSNYLAKCEKIATPNADSKNPVYHLESALASSSSTKLA